MNKVLRMILHRRVSSILSPLNTIFDLSNGNVVMYLNEGANMIRSPKRVPSGTILAIYDRYQRLLVIMFCE